MGMAKRKRSLDPVRQGARAQRQGKSKAQRRKDLEKRVLARLERILLALARNTLEARS